MEQIRQLMLSVEQKKALQEQYQATNNRRWQERIQCVLLKGQGLTLEAISEVVPYNINTLSGWIRDYTEDGVEGLFVWEYAGSNAHLNQSQQQELKRQVEQSHYGRVLDVIEWVKQKWQVGYSEDGMRELLHNLGFSYQKGQIVPGKANAEAQVLFLNETFKPMKANLDSADRYYFMDATHPTHNPVVGYSWALRGQRPQILSNTGRQRLNSFGAYGPLDQDYVGFETTQNINAEALLQLIDQLEKHQPHGRIILFSDNARYNHARCVREYLQHPDCRVQLVYLPPYSPNLNLIERLWGFMKDRVLKDQYYATFTAFQQAIQHFFTHLQDYANDLLSLMTENFQILNSD